ncbi:sigma-70 family RNA polymerase sigma factor [Cohnella sp. CFH 77786]|uniref:sigma-70 family RNA polymerase sigma factor n=1 Tax=Cohnella sp. CFH 77786 TaxID=2662265 RepID=UPI001C60F844|nr:sigma-70 family RNA polymerase sigma factor [Cohnella sp. CFH 77786]MBW5449397.1 sigma-70 family RNA polymerase sigma factor [Cohnella sp. CFH 77786]
MSDPIRKRSSAGISSDEELAELLREHYGIVFHYLIKATMDRTLAEDLAQETMVRAIEHYERYDGSSKFSSWLITIGTRLYLDLLRKRRTERRYVTEETRSGAFRFETLSRGGEWTELNEMLSALPEEVRTPLVLKHYCGYTYEEIGDMMSVAPGTVKSRIHHAIKKIREEWNV